MRLKLRNAELEGRAAEADRLAQLLGFREAHAEVPMLAARVIGGSPDAASNVVFINRGTRDGLRRDMGVITPEGVVGKIVAVFPDTSQVLLLDDRDSGVGALLAGSRTQSPVRGSGDPLLDMEYVSNDVKVEPGRGRAHFRPGPHLPQGPAGGHGGANQTRSPRHVPGNSGQARRSPGPPRRSTGIAQPAGTRAQESGRHPGRQCAGRGASAQGIRFSLARSSPPSHP